MTAFAHTTDVNEAGRVHQWATHAVPCLGGVKLFDSLQNAHSWLDEARATHKITTDKENEEFIKTIER